MSHCQGGYLWSPSAFTVLVTFYHSLNFLQNIYYLEILLLLVGVCLPTLNVSPMGARVFLFGLVRS